MQRQVLFIMLILFPFISLAQKPEGITLKNAWVLDEQIIRGPAPTTKLKELTAAGVTDVLIIKNQTSNEVDQEVSGLKELGFTANRIKHVPLKWKEVAPVEACHQTVEALSHLIQTTKQRGRKIYFHCTVGEDRTGMVAGLYRILTQEWSSQDAFKKEMCARGYAEGNRKKPAAVSGAIRENLTPLFLALVRYIDKGELSKRKLDSTFCDSTEFSELLENKAFRTEAKSVKCN